MYRNCIFCSAALGSNDSIESFPVGRQLAFDGWKGRLWAVCPLCARWNLAPIEERWETVEAAEKLFRDARLRVQSENVGLARLADGTKLVRVGTAVPGELAAWRYGTQLLRRRKRYFVVGAATVVAGYAVMQGAAAVGVGLWGTWFGLRMMGNAYNRRVIHRLPDPDQTGRPLIIRRRHLEGLSLHTTDAGDDLAVFVRDAHRADVWRHEIDRNSTDIVTVSGDAARALLSRAMVHVNRKGATRTNLEHANRILSDAGSAEHVLLETAAGGAALGSRAGRDPSLLTGPGALAFEMALNEQSERLALEGELAALEAAWREAEEIAGIADTLPGGAMVNRLLARLTV